MIIYLFDIDMGVFDVCILPLKMENIYQQNQIK